MTPPANVSLGRTAMADLSATPVGQPESIALNLPPRLFEYWYYAQVFYAVMGSALGLSLGLIGVSMLALLAACCVLNMGRRSLAILLPVALPLAFGLSYVVVQVVVFGEPMMGGDLRPFVPWILGVVVVHCLALRRGFLHRAAMAIFLMGSCMLPYLAVYRSTVSRLGLEQSGIAIANPDDFSAWFGFCCLYFTILGLETRRMSVRLLSVMTAIGCLLVVAVTVSRAPLFAVALGILVACRRALKRGFVPLLCLVALAWIAYGLGLFDESASLYASRGLEETGRLLIWPLAIRRFLNASLTGVGASHGATQLPGGEWITPHNSFILIALTSGVLPLLLFVGYWLRSGTEALRLNARSHEDAPFLIPLLLYALLISLELNQPYMFPWAMATLGTVGASGFLLRAKQSIAGRIHFRQGVRRPNPVGLSARTRAW